MASAEELDEFRTRLAVCEAKFADKDVQFSSQVKKHKEEVERLERKSRML